MSTTERGLGDLLVQLGHRDRPGAVWCAALIAERVMVLLDTDRRPQALADLELVRAWAQGAPVDWSVRITGDVYDQAPYGSPAYSALCAVEALMHCVQVAEVPGVPRSALVVTLREVPDHVKAALGGLRGVEDDLRDLFDAQQCPVSPTARDILEATHRAAVAWDYISERAPTPSRIGTLGEALLRAARLGLDWVNPVERAIAERAPLGPELRRLL